MDNEGFKRQHRHYNYEYYKGVSKYLSDDFYHGDVGIIVFGKYNKITVALQRKLLLFC
nr:MAG TPA: hypothetical protein [Caudoviricetes sp.]